MKHFPALDGVRGIAILAVILFHYTYLSCGWAGVQLFFVLSGYLITKILVADSDLPAKLYFQRFYWRRTMRIFPLYFGYLGVLLAVFLATGTPAVFGRCWQYLFTYTVNFQRLQPGFPNNPFFGHFWSLALEEQFYVMWPLLIFLLPLRGRRILVGLLLVLCPVVRALTAQVASGVLNDSYYVGQAVYSFTFSQMDAFAAGAALVFFRDRLTGKSVAGFALLTALGLTGGQAASLMSRGRWMLDSSLGYEINMLRAGQYIWGYTLINLWSAALILLATEKAAVARLLSHPACVFLGKISYGMYVFHLLVQQQVLAVLGRRHSLGNLAVFIVYMGVLSAVCWLSYRCYESYFLTRKDGRFRRPARVSAAGAGGGG
jgi:peptidoglycan/LPS O-acetylase OafA/YrhL